MVLVARLRSGGASTATATAMSAPAMAAAAISAAAVSAAAMSAAVAPAAAMAVSMAQRETSAFVDGWHPDSFMVAPWPGAP